MEQKRYSSVAIILVLFLIGLSTSCQSGPKRFKDPKVLANMEIVEDDFFVAADWCGEFYDNYMKLQNVVAMPANFDRSDVSAFHSDMDMIDEELADLDYADQEPYASAISSMEEVTELTRVAFKQYWGVEETLAFGRPASTAMKMDAISSIGRCSKGLQRAAQTIHIPKKEWPEWMKKWKN